MEHFLAKYSERYTRAGDASRETMAALEAWEWPGNVRELENTVNQIVLLGESSFMAPDRPSARGPQLRRAGDRPPPAARRSSLKNGLDAVTEQYEKRTIAESLARNGGNKSKTARELCITRKTLALKIAKYGLSR